MDTVGPISAAEAARRLGTTVPRVKRAIERLGLDVEQGRGGRVGIAPEQLARLRDELGVESPLEGLSRAQSAVLAALARAPFGLVSARAAARRAGISPTSASAALAQLLDRGLVEREHARIAAGRAREVELVRAASSTPRWRELAPALAEVRPPARRPEREEVVPERLSHLFWNVAPEQQRVREAGGSIARRLLQTGDPEGLAWGAAQLTRADWEHAARTRGLDPRKRRLARNLANAAARR
jgi:DNA-binding MarR family transcriptional regulator